MEKFSGASTAETHYIHLMSVIISFLLTVWAAQAAVLPTPKFSILQGATSDHVTHFTVMARRNERLRFSATSTASLPTDGPVNPAQVDRFVEPGSVWTVYRIRFDHLDVKSHYALQVFDAEGNLSDQRGFHLLDPDRPTGKLVFGSCMVRQFHNPFMWNALEKEHPDLLLLIGDAVYLDRENLIFPSAPSTELEVWTRFAESRNRLNLYFWRELVPTLSIWDDHDSGYNNDDAKYTLMPKVRHVFETFFANDAIAGSLVRGPGVARRFRLFGRNFILLDGRSFRDLSPTSPLFGALQEAWLHDQVQPGLNLIFSGSQFYGGFIKKDSLEFNWPDYALQFTRELRQVGEEKQATFLFASGDVHFSEVQRLEPSLYGYETFELTSSSIHSFAFPGHYLLKPSNPRRVRVTGTHNALVAEFTPTGRIHVRSLGWRGNDLFQMDLKPKLKPCERLLNPSVSLRQNAEVE